MLSLVSLCGEWQGDSLNSKHQGCTYSTFTFGWLHEIQWIQRNLLSVTKTAHSRCHVSVQITSMFTAPGLFVKRPLWTQNDVALRRQRKFSKIVLWLSRRCRHHSQFIEFFSSFGAAPPFHLCFALWENSVCQQHTQILSLFKCIHTTCSKKMLWISTICSTDFFPWSKWPRLQVCKWP